MSVFMDCLPLASTLQSSTGYLFPWTPALLHVRTGRGSLLMTSQRTELDFVVGVVIASVSLSVYLYPHAGGSPVALCQFYSSASSFRDWPDV